MKIRLTSVHVDDQDAALAFYTEKLGFVVRQNFPAGEFKWLTVVSAQEPDGVELLLEPNDNPIAQAYTKGLYAQSIPAMALFVDDIEAEYKRLTALGVDFQGPPSSEYGPTMAVLNDTCGNWIQLVQIPA